MSSKDCAVASRKAEIADFSINLQKHNTEERQWPFTCFISSLVYLVRSKVTDFFHLILHRLPRTSNATYWTEIREAVRPLFLVMSVSQSVS